MIQKKFFGCTTIQLIIFLSDKILAQNSDIEKSVNILDLQRKYDFYNNNQNIIQDSIIRTKFWVDFNKKIIEVYPSFKEFGETKLASSEEVQKAKIKDSQLLQSIINTTIENAKEAYLNENLEKEWEAKYEQETINYKKKEHERIDMHKKWLRTHWLENNQNKGKDLEEKLNFYRTEASKCVTDDSVCLGGLNEKINWYMGLIDSNNKMALFFKEQLANCEEKLLEMTTEKHFEMTPEILDLEKNLFYYKSHLAKAKLGIFDKTITNEYQDLELEINPDLKDYSIQRKSELDILLKNMNDHKELLKNKEMEVESKLKEFYKGFDSDWNDRQKTMEEIDRHLDNHNYDEVVRHIKSHYVDKLNDAKEFLNDYLNDKNNELNDCMIDDNKCKEKAQNIIDWLKKNMNNIDTIISFFERKMEEYTNKKVEDDSDEKNDEEVDKNKNRMLLNNSIAQPTIVKDNLEDMFGDDLTGEIFEVEEVNEGDYMLPSY